jgi:hypothetical protein
MLSFMGFTWNKTQFNLYKNNLQGFTFFMRLAVKIEFPLVGWRNNSHYGMPSNYVTQILRGFY